MAEAALELMCKRVVSRVAFHKPLSDQSVWRERIAKSRTLIDQTRLLVLHAAHRMDTVGNKVAAKEIAMIKVAAPNNCCKVIDWAIQAHGAGGFSQDFLLTSYYAYARHLRTADGPDEVHNNAIANTASVAGLIAAPKLGIYSATQHAVIGLTKTAAVIDTEMFRRANAADPKKGAFAQAMHPIGRIGKAEEIAGGWWPDRAVAPDSLFCICAVVSVLVIYS